MFPQLSERQNLGAVTPPWLGFRVATPRPGEMRAGAPIENGLRLRGVPLRWRTRIAVWDPPRRFVDVQLSGPYRLWHHTHDFEPAPDGSGGTLMRATVGSALPPGPL